MKAKQGFMMLLRMVVGWHFLYEGLWKLVQPNWSAVEYLRLSRWIGAPLFQWIAENPSALKFCDQLTMWGLVLIGLGLMSGVLVRAAAAAGALMLAFFYVAHPPFLTVGGANHFLLFDYNAVEAVALVAVAFMPGPGLWTAAKALWKKMKRKDQKDEGAEAGGQEVEGQKAVDMPERREVLAGLGALPVAAAFAGAFIAKHGTKPFAKKSDEESATSASYRFKYQGLSDLDFWMKTFHPCGYWSAQKTPQDGGEGEPGSHQRGWNDNNWCRDPQALSEWFQNRPEPWIAFKTMAAGAVHPRQSIPFVFNGGADAACMGMFDFQVVEDANLANDAFDKGFKDRKRPWIG